MADTLLPSTLVLQLDAQTNTKYQVRDHLTPNHHPDSRQTPVLPYRTAETKEKLVDCAGVFKCGRRSPSASLSVLHVF